MLEDRVCSKLVPFFPLFPVVVEESLLEVLCSVVVVLSQDLDILVLGHQIIAVLINDYKSDLRI